MCCLQQILNPWFVGIIKLTLQNILLTTVWKGSLLNLLEFNDTEEKCFGFYTTKLFQVQCTTSIISTFIPTQEDLNDARQVLEFIFVFNMTSVPSSQHRRISMMPLCLCSV
ncbi:hypothetical protein BsWGS_16282 [Bradybaena similaris]